MKYFKYLNYIFCFSSLLMVGCQSVNYVTKPNYPNEAALVANAYQNGLSAELNISYQQAFYNLKQAYQRCVAFTRDDQLVFTDNRFEPQFEQGTLFARTEGGAYLHKALVESIGINKTRVSLFLPKEYHFAAARFQKDLDRARGQDPECNIGAIIPVAHRS